jgi:hypothetical protein
MNQFTKLRQIREAIQKLHAEKTKIERAPVDLETALARMRQRVESLAQRYQPRIGEFTSHEPLPRYPLADPDQWEELLAWFFSDALAGRLEAEIRRHYASIALALSPTERAQRLAEVEARLLEAEGREEALVRAIEEGGLDVERRADAGVEAVLDVRE